MFSFRSKGTCFLAQCNHLKLIELACHWPWGKQQFHFSRYVDTLFFAFLVELQD